MKISAIIKIADNIRKNYDVSDPADLCHQFNVLQLYFPMGYAKAACKGFILKQNGRTAITVNSDISEDMQRIVMYHELSHYFLHVSTGLAESLMDSSVCSPASDMEYEADMLAAELSLNDDAVLDALNECGNFYEAAELLHTIPEMLDFKLRVMRERGFDLPDAPIYSTGGFLRSASGTAS